MNEVRGGSGAEGSAVALLELAGGPGPSPLETGISKNPHVTDDESHLEYLRGA